MSDSASRAKAYTLEGRVQGVGFRAFIRDLARDLALSGWTRNEADGTVVVEAVGDPDDLRTFETRLREGPPAARVESLRSRDLDVSPETDGFEIRF